MKDTVSWKRKHANEGNYKLGFYNSFLCMNSCGCIKIKSKNTRFTHESTRKILTSICECKLNAHEYSEKKYARAINRLAARTREWRLPYARAVLYIHTHIHTYIQTNKHTNTHIITSHTSNTYIHVYTSNKEGRISIFSEDNLNAPPLTYKYTYTFDFLDCRNFLMFQ